MRHKDLTIFKVLGIFLISLKLNYAADTIVTQIHPNVGSLNGGTRITIDGSGFARDQFNFGDGKENVGNKIAMVSSTKSFPCDIHVDGSHEKQLMCYTVPMPEDDYYVRVSVDGVDASLENHCNSDKSKCKYKPQSKYTPTIENISPRSGKPGTKLKIEGRIITDRYGSNIPASSNGLDAKLLRVYLGGQSCEVKDLDSDTFFGIEVDSRWDGHMVCKEQGTFIGHLRASFLVEGFGRSLPNPTVTRISSVDKVYMFQTYTGISSISHNSGSKAGGLLLTIFGKHFDETTAPVKVMVGETECKVQGKIQDEMIVCEVEEEPASLPTAHTGNRGIRHHLWNATTKSSSELDQISSLSTSAADYSTTVIDEMEYTSDEVNFVDRMDGFFIPPKTAEYIFYIKGDNQAKLYLSTDEDPANKSMIAESTLSKTNTYFDNSAQASSSISLVKGKSYYIEVVHRQSSGSSYVKVAARTMQTQFSDKDSGMVWMEKQKIVVNSVVTKDVFTLTITPPDSAKTAVSEVQTVTVNGPGESKFRLGLYNAYTGLLTPTSSGDEIKAALEALPSAQPETVTVTSSPTATGSSIVVTFASKKGDLPDMTYMISDEFKNVTTISVAETTPGVPSLEKYQFVMAGIPSPPVLPTATADEVKDALVSMFSVQCPKVLGNPSGTTFFENYESIVSGNFGTLVSNIEPFCGRYSTKNPWYIFHKGGNDQQELGKPLSQYKELCLAYKGDLSSVVLRFSYQDGAGIVRRASKGWSNTANTPDEWVFVCWDMLEKAKAARPGGTDYRADWITVSRKSPDEPLYIDSVSIARDTLTADPDASKQRMPPAKPNGAIIKNVEVTSSTTGEYVITLDPYDCGYDFPMIEIANAKLNSGKVDKTGTSASFSLCNGGTCLGAALTRTSKASLPVEGTFNVQFNGGTSKDIPPSTSGELVAQELQRDFGDTLVTRNGDCANFNYEIKWLSGGNKPAITVDGTKLTGNTVTSSVEQVQDGSLWYDPIPGDLLRTKEDKPQVQLYINKLPSTCDGDCSFEWTTASTPTITGVTPTTGTLAQGTSITITGTDFDTTPSNNTVEIEGVACTPTASTATTITCDVGTGPTGTYDIVVTVSSKGRASGSVQFTYVSGISSISPAIGSIGGGTKVTVTGYGFRENDTVAVGGNECKIMSVAPGQIICLTPAAATTSGGSVDLIVNQFPSGQVTSGTQFNYDATSTSTPVITAISTTSSAIEGGETITITGTGFGASASSDKALKIGENYAVISSYSDTQVIATLPSNKPGTYPIELSVGILGFADLRTNSISSIVYDLKITNVYPSQGSLYGGTSVTITGTGFTTNTSLLDIKFGPHNCNVESATSTKIVCTIEDTGKVYVVRNTGTHPTHGYGYGWEPHHLNVKVGDRIKWEWTYAKFLNGIENNVVQTVNASTGVQLEGGFNSGPKVKNGAFEHRVTKAGRIDYWSGYVDEYSIIDYRGTLQVDPLTSHYKQLVLKIAGHEAIYQPGGSNPSSSGGCAGTLSTISGCSDPAPTPSDATKFNFKFWSCLSPAVTKMDLSNGTTDDNIELTGSGFGANACENQVKLGSANGVQQSVTNTKLVFKVDPASEMPIGVRQKLSLRVHNLGYALIDVSSPTSAKDFALLPWSFGVSPSSGSVKGGTRLTIAGSGFQGSTADITVNMDIYQCDVISVSYTEIVCTTPAMSAGTYNVSILVSVNGNNIPVVCTSCSYTYSNSDTPTVTDSDNKIVNGATTITITGTMFHANSSYVSVSIAGETCVVSSSTTSQIVCDISGLPNGNHTLNVLILGKGKATSSVIINSPAEVTSITPSTGSIHGGQDVTIAGNGFTTVSNTSVQINSKDCVVKSVTFSQIVCTTPSNSAMTANIAITSNGQDYTVSQTYTYSNGDSAAITSINPTSGVAAGTLTITGTGFNAVQNKNTVSIGGVECVVTSSSTTSITCTLGNAPAGAHPVVVKNADTGFSDSATSFTYTMVASSLSPGSGSAAGGQTLTITGSGFVTDAMVVTICGENCTIKSGAAQSSSSYVCTVPASTTAVSGTRSCSVDVIQDAITQTLSYSYDESKTPDITGVSPARGGTAGGTSLTITGTGFGTNSADVSVTIDGYDCPVDTVIDTQIVCTTGAAKSSDTSVNVAISGKGNAKQTSAAFYYIDVWSSNYTWGNNPPPTAGDLVVIPANQTILLDTNTPVLKMLIIQGGKLIFDAKDIELQAEYILITDGGLLQVGTESAPFQHKGIITLFGHQRSKELPIYGAKCLAVREGTLDLHGRPTHVTWTRLAATANIGATTIQLQVPVEWQVNDYIVIATTGHRHSQKETEKRKITAISGDKLTLTLDRALEYQHLGITETISGQSVDFRAEVGLLTHNVVVRGSRQTSWEEKIEACPDGFNTGEFATQTCFQGRFGEEMGSDQFGAQIIFHAPRMDEDLVIGRLSYIEVNYAGQAFRLGRYPVHFHLNGIMSESYVRGLGIHETFNRAVNVHNTHTLLIEHTVIYNIMGGSFFLEDGIETGNIFQYNLALFTRASSSLLNDDVTPAAFWATNPNNTFRHNTAAGGTHFGFWYRMHNHPEGPSRTTSVCPKHVPLGEFKNNTVHSQGWFGLWVFPDYFPRVDGACSTSAATTPAVFESLFAWNNEKGAEFVNYGALQLKDSILVNNEFAGYEGKLVMNSPQYTTSGALLEGGMIVGKVASLPRQKGTCTTGGLVAPYNNGLLIKGVKFVNFNDTDCAVFRTTTIDGTCGDKCGGFTYKVEGLSFDNANRKVFWRWLHNGAIVDKDGSLTGQTGYTLVPTMDLLDPSKCTSHAESSISSIPGSICDPTVKFHRFAFNNIKPKSLEAKEVQVTNQFGSAVGPFMTKRISHKPGWVVMLPSGQKYNFTFVNGEQITNTSWSGAFYQFENQDTIIMSQKVEEKPDRVMIDGATPIEESTTELDTSTNVNGDWKYDPVGKTVDYVVSARTGSSRKKRAAVTTDLDKKFNLNLYKCYYKDCIPPPDPLDLLATPNTTYRWSDAGAWLEMGRAKPVAGDDVTITRDFWFILDETPPKLGKLIIEGGLEFLNELSSDLVLDADLIYVKGRLVIGWDHTPFEGKAEIILHGEQSTPPYPVSDGPALGSKFIAVFGGLEAHGKGHSVQWTRLSETANAGANQIKLQDAVTWAVGDEIVLAPTSLSVWHTETFKINAISDGGKTLTLNSSLAFNHISYTENLDTGETYTLAAEVGHLTRNIKIRGKDYPKMMTESFGARVVVGRTAEATKSYIGVARISNVEFVHSGQEGWTESYDARFSVSFMDVVMKSGMPSYVKMSAFHNGFSPAIGVFGTNDLFLENNVIHRTVEYSIISNSAKTKIKGNLMVLNQWSGSYLDRAEPKNFRYPGSVELIEATEPILIDNVVAGSERIGFHVMGEPCTGTSVEAWSGNQAHTCLIGAGLLPIDKGLSGTTCAQYSNFLLWKNGDFGIYYNNEHSFKARNIVSADNRVGIFTLVIGPGAQTFGNKYTVVENSLIIGHTPSFDCAVDRLDRSDVNIQLSGQGRSFGNGTSGVVGLSTTTFNAGSNSAPEKPFLNIMAYNSMYGHMTIENVTFARFAQYCNPDYDYAITTNPKNDDAHHPTELKNIKLTRVGDDNKIYYHIPNVGKINSADCVDMDCDGLKKNLIEDMDGSLLGSPGTIISWSEYQWNGDRRRGLGDHRIPKVLLTDGQGQKRDVNAIAPNKGLIRNQQCIFHDYWRAYECHNIDHKILIIESKDADTETRRISPVAVLSEGYLDLINGPQDHGWCSGYTCRKRLSTFQAMVAVGKNHDIYFTGTTPQHLKFYMLDATNTEGIRIGVWYASPNRLDVHVNGQFIMPKNGEMKNGKYLLKPSSSSVQYMPSITEATGTNYVKRNENMIFVVIKGSDPVEIKVQSVVIVSFSLPAMTVDDFFGENLIQNMAAFLKVDPRKVRIVDVVSESSRRRRKRTVSTTKVIVEIGDEPNDSDPLSYDSLTQTSEKIINQAQLGSFDEIVNATVLAISTVEPTPPPTNPSWADTTNDDPEKVVTKPQNMEFYESVVPGKEQNVMATAPRIRVKDTQGNYVKILGASTSPWQVTATLRSNSDSDSRSVLGGTKTVTFTDGWANFTDLTFSHKGSGYVIDFQVTSPPEAANFSLATSALVVPARAVTAHVVSISTSLIENQNIEMILDLRDDDTSSVISDIAWRNHTWYCEVSLADPSLYYGSLGGTTNLTFDSATARVAFQNLTLSSIGTYFLDFHVYTEPAEYDFHYERKIIITNAAQNAIVVERTNVLELKLDGVFDSTTAPYIGVKVMNFYIQKFKNSLVRITDYNVKAGSIIVSLTIEGNFADMNSTVYELCNSVQNTTAFSYGNTSLTLMPYMNIDGSAFYGVSCGPIPTTEPKEDDGGLHPGIIAALVILSVALVAVIVAFVVWKCCVVPKTKTHASASQGKYLGYPNILSAEDTLFSERSFTGLNGSSASTPVPPVDTNYILPIDKHSHTLKFKM